MSVIQNIRDKYARWAVIAIALALLGFIMMDAFAGRTGLFGGDGPGNTLGKVNGEKIDYREFLQDIDDQVKQAGRNIDENERQQLTMYMWDQKVTNIVMDEEYDALGLAVTDKEIRSQLTEQLRQKHTDEKGNFNSVAAQQEVNTFMKDEKLKDQAKYYFLQKKYLAMFSGSVYYPKWFVEKRNVDNSMLSKVSYVAIPFATIDDKTVNVTDEEIQKYINDHKDDFEQKEEARTVSFVTFSAAPTSADSAAIRAELEKLKEKFVADSNTAIFVNNQQGQFEDIYKGSNDIQSMAKDTLVKLPVGGVYGPYVDGNNYTLAKMVAIKSLPDSVKCRHILIGTINPQTGAQTTPDSVAKAKIDSIETAIKGGASFDLLDSLYSTDEVAKKDKGVMTFSASQIQGPNFAKEFGDFILTNGKPGDKKVIKTQFGYHYIEIMEHKNVTPHYKIAFVNKQIVASDDTENDASNKAAQFAGDSRDAKSFDENYEKKLKSQGILKSTATVNPLDNNLQGLPNARSLVKKIFEADKGEVLEQERIGDQYIVTAITDISKPGLKSVAQVKQAMPMIVTMLVNKKKAEQIIKNLGKFATLEEVAAKNSQQVQTVDSLRFENPRALGYEPRVLGAAFNAANKGKVASEAIIGSEGVYVLRVDDLATTPVDAGGIEEQQKMLEAQAKSQLSPQYGGQSPIINALKESANIKDYRYKFY